MLYAVDTGCFKLFSCHIVEFCPAAIPSVLLDFFPPPHYFILSSSALLSINTLPLCLHFQAGPGRGTSERTVWRSGTQGGIFRTQLTSGGSCEAVGPIMSSQHFCFGLSTVSRIFSLLMPVCILLKYWNSSGFHVLHKPPVHPSGIGDRVICVRSVYAPPPHFTTQVSPTSPITKLWNETSRSKMTSLPASFPIGSASSSYSVRDAIASCEILSCNI